MAALDAVGAGGARELERLGLDPVAGEDGKKTNASFSDKEETVVGKSM